LNLHFEPAHPTGACGGPRTSVNKIAPLYNFNLVRLATIPTVNAMIATMLRPILLSINLIGSSVARVITTSALDSQQTLQLPHKIVDIMTTKESQQLPGDNQAYFCSSLNQQLFKIEEFDIAPNPPVVYVNSSS
jgi:hypothetical protein